MKAPAFQFYPGDWQRDVALRSCSVSARGLWIEMMCIMHQAAPYGHLVVNGKPICASLLARMVGARPKSVEKWLGELRNAAVFDTESETIISRRMVKDEHNRRVRAEAGKLGGNPLLKDNRQLNQTDNQTSGGKVKHEPNLRPTPSSSSSSSPSGDVPAADAAGVPVPAPMRKINGNGDSDSGAIPDCPHEMLIALYHETLPENPDVREWTDKRRDSMRARWREKAVPSRSGPGYATVKAGLDWWRAFFQHVGRSSFLTGRTPGSNGRPPFMASLPWLIKPENLAKVIEGNYDDR